MVLLICLDEVCKMATKDSLGDRMKNYYEGRAKTYLTRRMPVIVRLDGRAFHSFTKGFQRPYDELFHNAMNRTLEYLCSNIQGCKFGYTQSDEITLVLTDYDTLDTDGWFDYAVQKMCSISASMATLEFNRAFNEEVNKWFQSRITVESAEEYELGTADLYERYNKSISNGAMFDSRVFNIPREEVANCLIWRQQDATRNAIQMLGQSNFSHKELQGKSCNDIQDMLMTQKGINFNDMPTEFKRGVCAIKREYQVSAYNKDGEQVYLNRSMWYVDKNIPIFTQDRNYIERYI